MSRKTRPMATIVALAALALAPSLIQAQGFTNEDPVLRGIWDEAMNNSHVEELAQVLLDAIGPRLTGSPGMLEAQEWAVGQLRDWGIEANLEEYGTWEGWERGISHIDLVSPRVRSLEGRILAWSPGTGGQAVEAEVIALPTIQSPADWSRFLGTVSGKWVMMSFPEPTCRADAQWVEFGTRESVVTMMRNREAARNAWGASLDATGSDDARRRDLHAQLEEAGAAGIVTSQWPGAFGTTRVFNAYNRATPTFELGCEDYSLVHRLAANGHAPTLRLTAESENHGEVPVFNVVGEIPGTEWPDQYVVLSAHYDSWEGGSGATDNASGSILMLETMRILKEVYPAPKRTILIGLWSGEEQGLNGSRAFTEDRPEVVRGLQALWNQDNGTGRVVRLGAHGIVGASESLARWMSMVPTSVADHVELDLPGSPGVGNSDYAAFLCHGAPGFNLMGLSWDYGTHTWHTTRDTYDKLVWDDIRNNVVLTASLAYLSANDPEFTDRTRRMVRATRDATESDWPTCERATRNSKDSSRM